MKLMRILVVLTLALSMLSAGQAAASGSALATHTAVICGPDGATTVRLDASGRPVAPLDDCVCLLCDHCLPSPPALPTFAVLAGPGPALSRIRAVLTLSAAVLRDRPAAFAARGPPPPTKAR